VLIVNSLFNFVSDGSLDAAKVLSSHYL